MALTPKQKIFADEYLIDLNATRAYKAAYPNIRSDETAAAAGARLLRNVNVAEYIDQELEKLRSERVADIQEVLEYLTSVMRREKKECIVVTVTKERSEYIKGEDGKPKRQTVKEEIPQIVEIPAKLSDANKAAELLGRRYSMFTEKIELSGKLDAEKTKLDDLIKQMCGDG